MVELPAVSVVIPNLNGEKFLAQCLSSLGRQTIRSFEAIVVDNGSTDGSVALIEGGFPWVRLVKLPENTGFAHACNVGITESKARFVALLNNDTEAEPGWLEELRRAAEKDGRVGMVSSKILLDSETREIDSVGMLIYPDGIGRQRGRGEIDRGQYDNEEEVLFAHAAAALYRKAMLNEIGLFDEDFFAYAEDTDIGLRARRAGWGSVYAPGAVVYHKYSVTAGRYSSFKALHLERNRIWVAVKNFPLSWLFLAPFYSLVRYALQLYGAATGRGSAAGYSRSLSAADYGLTGLKAYCMALKGLPRMIGKRRAIKKRLSGGEFARLLSRYRISVSELILKD
ncbi:MAG: glycosyltransferase family 2 protein [Nitrospiraceae bacterium]|nr:glycosyltransferase family 2 protein [Nitrospiraceae bacterium]